MNKKLLFVNQRQFGYHITYFKYCKYLKTDFDITYVCWDYERNRIAEEGIDIVYISRFGNIMQRNLRFIKIVLKHIEYLNFQYIFVNYFRGCSIIPIMFNRKHRIHLDIVSGSISSSSILRIIYNLTIRLESFFFKSVSIISAGLRTQLKISSDAFILPLGADLLDIDRHADYKLSLIYVGTFYNRRIDETIAGLGLFLKKHPNYDIHYTIIGEGLASDIEHMMINIRNYDLDNYVELKGYIPLNEIEQYLSKANVGVSYIPITRYFKFQPATKTYEYLMSGMPVIATCTFENKKIINEKNGLIINDTPQSFAQSLEFLCEKIDDYKAELIRESVVEYKWESIVSRLKENILNNK